MVDTVSPCGTSPWADAYVLEHFVGEMVRTKGFSLYKLQGCNQYDMDLWFPS